MLSPLDSDTIPAIPAGSVLDIQFAWLQDGAPAHDESVSVRVRNDDTGALLAAFTYGAGILYDSATGTYSQPFDTGTYGVAAGTRLKVMVYMGGKLQGTAYVDVQSA